MVLLIFQWNARSLIANGQEFKKFISDLDKRPDIICIQETWFKPQLNFVLQGYQLIRKDRKNCNGGGVAIFIKQGVGYRNVEVSEDQEALMMEVWEGNQSIKIINFYNPCEKLCKNAMEKIRGNTSQKVVWCGDFNAHNTLWGSVKTDYNGLIVEEMLDWGRLVCINNGNITRIDVSNGRNSALDITLVSEDLARKCEWSVSKQSSMGSDHYPIWCQIGVDIVQTVVERMPRWKFKGANWELFKELCNNNMNEMGEIEEIEELSMKVIKVLRNTAEEVIGKTKTISRRKAVPWWNEKCSKAVRERNKAMKKARKSVLFTDYIIFKRAQAMVRREIRIAKRMFWREYCNRIGEDIEINDVWNMIRKMGGIQRNINIPVLVGHGKIAIKDSDKAEMLVEAFVKVHSNDNITDNMKKYREQKVKENEHIYEKKIPSGSRLDSTFTLYELKRALVGVKHTSPGKDEICYEMIKQLSDGSLNIILRLFNKIWDSGNIPVSWKHGVIVPIAKPGKDHSQPVSYRPIALTSNLCKLMERMVMNRLTYEMESKGMLSACQSGFRKGRNTMDSILSLEAEIRKAQVNKEMLVGVFFDVEKAYDMLWKEGLLMKLESLGIEGKMYNWISSFLFGRTIQVRVGSAYSRILSIENGTPQGSVSSPILFNLMINDIFRNIETGIGRSLYADDGALWKRGRNRLFVENKMQKAVKEVEKWSNSWGFRFSVVKTQVICFSNKKNNPMLNIKMYGNQLEQVNVVRFLGMWMDYKLNFGVHIQKLIEKCKKGINVLRCLSGADWGASCQSLKRIYYAVIRSNIDYGSMVYSSANKTLLKKIQVIQNQALRICCGAFRSSPVVSLQVELGELSLEQRRLQLRMRYWSGVCGHLESHPVKILLKECWEYEYKEIESFGWVVGKEANSLGLKEYLIAPSVPIPAIPPWMYPMPLIDLQIHKEINNQISIPTKLVVEQYVNREYYSVLQVFTDGSKEPESCRTAAAVFIPTFNIKIAKRLSDHVSVFTTELLAIILALQWIEEVQPSRIVICTDSMAALTSLMSGKSESRQDLIFEVLQGLFRARQLGVLVFFLWVPAHVGVDGNEEVDKLAKKALKHPQIEINVSLSKSEIKRLIAIEISKKWQKIWNNDSKGRHLYQIQERVGNERKRYGNRKKDVIITRLRIGHTALNYSLYKIGKHDTGKCDNCGELETVQHILLECAAYERERQQLSQELGRMGVDTISIKVLLGNGIRQSRIHELLFKYLNKTGIVNRI